MSQEKIIKRLRIIQGQVGGLEKMILDEEKDCTAIMIQLKAVMSSLKSVGNNIVEESLESCIRDEDTNTQKQMIQDILKLYSSL